MIWQSEMMNNFYVYEHIRKDNGDVFYVGKGRKNRASRTDGRSDFWKRVVNKSGGFSVRLVMENMTEDDAFLLEKQHISQLRAAGARLCNLSDGGEGPSGVIRTKEYREKMSIAKTGIHRPEYSVKKSAAAKTKKMTGLKFGRLTVIEIDGERKPGRHPKWKCVCDCGNTTTKTATALRNGREPSCGCATRDFQRKKNDLAGKKFGRLTVLQPVDTSNSKRHIIWNCVCECGKNNKVSGTDLRSGHVRSCGCLHSEIVANINRRKTNEK